MAKRFGWAPTNASDYPEPCTCDPLAYLPCREDGLDKNLRRMNQADFDAQGNPSPEFKLDCPVHGQHSYVRP